MSLQDDLGSAVQTWVGALSPHTRKAYQRGILQFADYLVECELIPPSVERTTGSTHAPMKRDGAALREDLCARAGAFLLGQKAGEVNALVQAYIQHLCTPDVDGLPMYTRETVKQRVSALRWAVKEARRRGLVTWSLEVVIPRPAKDPQTGRLLVRPGREMKGPTLEQLRAMLEAAHKRARGKNGDGARWLVVLCLIAHETLREEEIVAIDRDDVHMGTQILTVARKRDQEPSTIPLSARTTAALRRWLRRRGERPGPLLWGGRLVGGRCLPAPGSRLTVDGVYYIVQALGRCCGVDTSPHKVRHTAITVGQGVRERLGIPLHDAMRRAGHRSIEAHERYLDPDLDNVRRLSNAVADALRGET
jgi:integrase